MDGVGDEVTQQIRNAIKGKLTELGAYVDDELPDYIMVMVANKKSKAQMVEDLNLFLGNSTEVFTTWLHDVLDRLQFITVVKQTSADILDESAKNIITSSTQQTTNEVPKEISNTILNVPHTVAEVKTSMPRKLKRDKVKLVDLEENEDFLALKDEPDIDDPLVEELKEEAVLTGIKKTPPKAMATKPIIKRQNVVAPIQKALLSMDKTENLQRPSNVKKRLTLTEIKPRLQRPFSTVGAVVRRPEQFVDEEEEEYDPHNPSVASVVCVSERKSSVPPALQASTLLLQKAVEDAHKSVIGKNRRSPTRIEPYKPTPITQLFARNRRELITSPAVVNQKEMVSQQVPIAEIAQLNSDSDIDFDEKSLEEHDTRIVISCPEKQQEVNKESSGLEDAAQEEGEYILKQPSQISGGEAQKPKLSGKRKADEANLAENNEPSPHFVVTLDGVDPSHFIRKRAKRNVISNQPKSSTDQDTFDILDLDILSGDDFMQVEEVDESKVEDENKKPEKIKERCRYWPACKNGDNCEYHHPRMPCKTFPNCKFGDKCLYIHPNCKFDALCTRRECPFTHASKRALPTAFPFAAPPMKPKIAGMRKICRFLPNCHNLQCQYYHPKPCRYGNQCQASGCPFSHSAIPSPAQLKWTAPKL